MRRLVIYLPVAALSFCLGLAAFGLRQAEKTSPDNNEPLAVSLCELEADPVRYDGKLVRVQAVLHSDMEPYLYDRSCATSDTHQSPLITIPGDNNFVVPEWAARSASCGTALSSAAVGAPVTVVGVFEAHYHASNNPPDVRHPRIKPKSILQLLPPSAQEFLPPSKQLSR